MFHEGDFVTLSPRDGGSLLEVFQVHRLQNTYVLVRKLNRHKPDDAPFKHDRLLAPSENLERIDRPAFKPEGICHVSILQGTTSSFMSEPTDFFVTQDEAKLLRPECTPCTLAYKEERRKRRSLKPLRAMEIMCGAGGLSLGLDLSGACETKFAIDMDADSTKTFQGHHSKARVYCGDSGEALRRAIGGLRSHEGMRYPRPGEVDVIVSGPPCQGFSKNNRHVNRDAAEKDPRNLLVCTVLGWVDFLQPKYFVMENVEGFTLSKLGGVRTRNGQASNAMLDDYGLRGDLRLRSVRCLRLPAVEEATLAPG